jgi:predicted dienelactone hydrolase
MSDSNTANAQKIASAPTMVVSARPVVLSAPGRGEDLQVRISAPATGSDLPVIVFSHGFGLSMNDYAPLADFWAAHGFVVLQPTHLDSRTLGLSAEDPRTPRIWRFRIQDLKRVLDGLDVLEASVPGASTAAASLWPATPGEPRRRARCWARAFSTLTAFPERTCPTPVSTRVCCSP